MKQSPGTVIVRRREVRDLGATARLANSNQREGVSYGPLEM